MQEQDIKTSEHEFSTLLDGYFGPISDIISNIESREECFVKPIVVCKETPKFSNSIFSFFLSDFLNETSIEAEYIKLESPQIGQTEVVNYYIKLNDIRKLFVTKTYKCVLYELHDGYFNVNYDVIEIKHSYSCSEEDLANKYSLIFIVRETENSTYIYAKLTFDSSLQTSNLFTKELQEVISTRIYSLSYDQKYSCTYTSIESVIINASRQRVFSIASEIAAFKGCESIYNSESGDTKKTKLDAIGDKYKFYWKTLDIYMEFEVVEYQVPTNDDEDYILTRHLYHSSPEQIKFNYSHILKKIDEVTTLVVFKFVYENTVRPEFMSCLKKDKIVTLVTLKKLSEEPNS